jgi:hypothetical protein
MLGRIACDVKDSDLVCVVSTSTVTVTPLNGFGMAGVLRTEFLRPLPVL